MWELHSSAFFCDRCSFSEKKKSNSPASILLNITSATRTRLGNLLDGFLARLRVVVSLDLEVNCDAVVVVLPGASLQQVPFAAGQARVPRHLVLEARPAVAGAAFHDGLLGAALVDLSVAAACSTLMGSPEHTFGRVSIM
jgi:hypothetical protein